MAATGRYEVKVKTVRVRLRVAEAAEAGGGPADAARVAAAVDHLVLGGSGYVSFRDRGLL